MRGLLDAVRYQAEAERVLAGHQRHRKHTQPQQEQPKPPDSNLLHSTTVFEIPTRGLTKITIFAVVSATHHFLIFIQHSFTMLGFHKEGNTIIAVNLVLFVAGMAAAWLLLTNPIAQIGITAFLIVWIILILQFFRNPDRRLARTDESVVYAPADGKVVVIEEVEETEYFKDRRLQVSIFMSPLNVHVNRNPVTGIVRYAKYHAGKYLAAWNPKSSTENERTTVVYEATNGQSILMRQVAGALARRIVFYVKAGDQVTQGEDMGFIKFGSRVDMYFPLGTKIDVKIGDISRGNRTIIARW